MKKLTPTAIGLVVTAFFFIVCTIAFWSVSTTVVIAVTMAAVMVPIAEKVEKRFWPESPKSWHKTMIAAAAMIVALIAFGAFVAVVVVVVVQNFDFLQNFGVETASTVQEWLGENLGAELDLKRSASESLNQLLSYTRSALFTIMGLAARLVLFAATLFLFVRYGGDIMETIRRTLSQEKKEIFNRFSKAAYSSLYAVYIVHLSTGLVTFIIAMPFFYLIGYGEHMMFWSLLCALFQLVPILGPSFIMATIGVYTFATGDTTTGILVFAIGYPVVVLFPDIVFRPLMMGREMKLSPLILILGFIGGVVSLGFIGFVAGPFLLKMLTEAFSFTSHAIEEGEKL